LDAHSDASKEEYAEKQKVYEEKIRPVMMKLYQGGPGAQAGPSDPSGPSVEEVD